MSFDNILYIVQINKYTTPALSPSFLFISYMKHAFKLPRAVLTINLTNNNCDPYLGGDYRFSPGQFML